MKLSIPQSVLDVKGGHYSLDPDISLTHKPMSSVK